MSLPRRRRRPLIVASVIVITATVAATTFGLTRRTDDTEAVPLGPITTVPVTRQMLARTFTADGNLGYGETWLVGPPGHSGDAGSGPVGTVTWLPVVGSVVDRGQQIYRIDDLPTVLFFGVLPFYRELGLNSEGPDVRQLEENLVALGYGGFTVDNKYTAQTVAAVKGWQKDLGREKTGTVGTDEVYVAPGPIRVSEEKVRVGATATTDLISVSGVDRVVSATLDIDDAQRAIVGASAVIVLPDGRRTDGMITAIGQPVTPETVDGAPGAKKTTVTITVSVTDPAVLGDLTNAKVEVELSTDARADVLTVPVSALLALAEGGYGVEVSDGATTRLVSVTTGLFSSGRVEVTGDLDEGDQVVVPS